MGDIYRAAVLTQVNNVGTVNVMHFEEVSTGTNPDREAELRDFIDPTAAPPGGYGYVWKYVASQDAEIVCMKLQKVSPAPEGTLRHYFVSGPGEVASGAAAANLNYVIRLYSDTASKRGRGRHFFSGIPLSFLDGGQYAAAAINPLTNFAALFGDGAESNDGTTWRGVIHSPTDDDYKDCRIAHFDPVPRNHRSRNAVLCGA
jgi:hypothetical protein